MLHFFIYTQYTTLGKMKDKTIKLNKRAHAALLHKKAEVVGDTGNSPSFSKIIVEALHNAN